MSAHPPTARANIFAAIVKAIAEREGVDLLELPPLGDSVDVDALQALVEGPAEESITISFTYIGYEVTATSDGDVHVS